MRALRWTLASLTLWGANELAGAILALWVFHFAVNVPIDEYGLVPRVVAQLVPVLATSAPFSWPVIVIGGGRARELHLLRARFRCTVSSPLVVPRARKWGLNIARPVTCVHVTVELATEMTGGLAKTGCSMTSVLAPTRKTIEKAGMARLRTGVLDRVGEAKPMTPPLNLARPAPQVDNQTLSAGRLRVNVRALKRDAELSQPRGGIGAGGGDAHTTAS